MWRVLRVRHARESPFGDDRRGSGAVEFALLAPVLMLFLFGIICFSTIFSIASALQQLAAESARASVAGLSDTERGQIVQNFITANIGSYPFLLSRQLTVATSSITTPSAGYRVSLTYDLSSQIGTQFGSMLPLAVTRLQRSAVVLTSTSL